MSITDAFYGLLGRVLPEWKDEFLAIEVPMPCEGNYFEVAGLHNKVVIKGDTAVSLAMGLYAYLKDVMCVNVSWCGNRKVKIPQPIYQFPAIKKSVSQKYRVYMNYCTLSYTMAYWDFAEWEREIDFMAMRGINMPLAVVGTEAVMYETLLKFGFTEEESAKTVSAPAFQAWQWMTNIDSYEPIPTKNLLQKRLTLGKQIMNRYLELGMFPIQQGFSGHIPAAMKTKFPDAKIAFKWKWCDFPKTAQLDPTDPLFTQLGTEFLKIQKEHFGAHGFYACDPFHEGVPPRIDYFYLRRVGKTIDKMYFDFDKNSVWVMQSWSILKFIACSVPKNRLLILDLDGARCKKTRNFWGYSFISGHLHNFGGKNSLHGNLKFLAENKYFKLKKLGAKVVGTGLFPEGVEQNPIYYDLLFDVLTDENPVDIHLWLKNYALRRYGKEDANAVAAWEILLASVYAPHAGAEEEAGSVTAARPSPLPKKASPCDEIVLRYENSELWRAIELLLQSEKNLGASDGYRFDLADLTRQAISNAITKNQQVLPKLVEKNDFAGICKVRDFQLQSMRDLDSVCAMRPELSLSRWLGFAERAGDTPDEKRFTVCTAKLLVTLWGDVNADPTLFDYAWKEWHGLIRDYYIPRWEMFYAELLKTLGEGKSWEEGKDKFFNRPRALSTPFGKKLFAFETNFVAENRDYPEKESSVCFDTLREMVKKYK